MDPLTILGLILGGGYLAKGGLDTLLQYGAGGREIKLQERLAGFQQEGAKTANEENRRMTEKYLAMLSESQNRKDKMMRDDRQSQMMMAMLQSLSGFNQGQTQLYGARTRPVPPTSITGLMRGL